MVQYIFVCISLFSIMITGCSKLNSTQSFVREDVDLGFVLNIAVLPFENHTNDKFVMERVRDVTITQVLALGLFDVVDKGLVDSVLREEAIDKNTPIDKPTIKRLGQLLNIQALLIGSVDESNEKRLGSTSYPELTLTLRLVETKSGMILWQASGHRCGDSLLSRLLGLTPTDSFQVALRLVRDLLATVPFSAEPSSL